MLLLEIKLLEQRYGVISLLPDFFVCYEFVLQDAFQRRSFEDVFFEREKSRSEIENARNLLFHLARIMTEEFV